MIGISPELTIDLIIMGICLLFSAVFSGAETAITSLSELKTKHLIDVDNTGRTDHLLLWLEHPGRVLTTILIVNNMVNILASAIATKIAMSYSQSYGVGIATGFTTFIVLICGEVIPKSFAKAHADSLCLLSLKLVRFTYRLIFPVVWVLSGFAAFIIKQFGSGQTSIRPSITEEELEFLINESESEGVIKDFKKDMISGVFEFDETKVREIMTPRPDISSIEKGASYDDVVKLSIRTGHSRIPVHEEHMDNIIGIVFAKDLLRLAYSSNGEKPKISDVMREAFYVPESKTIIDVFKDLKRTKNHMAIVIDEHGGTAGLVTMEDILEEIVGEIQDEFDVEEAKILEIDNNIFDVAGSVNVDEFSEYFDLDDAIIEETDTDADTVGGLLTHLLGDLPEVGQKSQLGPLVLEVSEVGRKRIERLRVTRVVSGFEAEKVQA